MSPAGASQHLSTNPRIGIPWRTSREEDEANSLKIRNYQDAVRLAGGEPVLLSLHRPEDLGRILPTLDAFVLPGSPADIAPADYGAVDHGKSAPADAPRERTDRAILTHALAEKKPVLAICYGCQLLNVFLGGTLIQDIQEEIGTTIAHSAGPHRESGAAASPQADPLHSAAFESSSRIAAVAAGPEANVNSSHHQAIARPGGNLRVTAHAPDGIVEAVEWTGDANWVVGVQWHPERMADDAFSQRLFGDFVAAARTVHVAHTEKV
ncbi:MAG: gamma-glutamyl-gamma-aminobutyrate hydrolase family protein [Candidatus Acidiferrum sp.]